MTDQEKANCVEAALIDLPPGLPKFRIRQLPNSGRYRAEYQVISKSKWRPWTHKSIWKECIPYRDDANTVEDAKGNIRLFIESMRAELVKKQRFKNPTIIEVDPIEVMK